MAGSNTATVYLVRHGKAAAGFGAHLDPGLDAVGQLQAEATAEQLEPRGPLPIYTSPLARARETAEALATRWASTPVIEPRVSELPTPTQALAERARWVATVMEGGWSRLDAGLQAWRRAVVDCVGGLEHDCVVFSHFIAINAVVGFATDDDRVVTFRPDNASVTTCLTRGGRVAEVLERGREAETEIR